MKAIHFFITAIFVFCLGFAKDEIVELEQYLNGRSSENFLQNAGNIKFTLPPKTTGKIQRVKHFSSGNYGLEIEVREGPHKGELAWVYYNAKSNDPGLKVYASEADLAKNQTTSVIEKAALAKTTRSLAALREPASAKSDRGDAQKVLQKISDGNSAAKVMGRPGGECAGCEVEKVFSRGSDERKQYSVEYEALSSVDKPAPVAPRVSENRNSSLLCVNPLSRQQMAQESNRLTNRYYSFCNYSGESAMGQFSFVNTGPNKIVTSVANPKTGYTGRSRQWAFSFPGGATQDISISVMDGEKSQSVMMLFPRKSLPQVRVSGNRKIVTLPTGETVTFSAEGSEILGGVMREGPVTQGIPQVKYGGTGVLVRVDLNGTNDPRLVKTASISKQGKSCRVPAADLWPDRRNESSLHFKFPTDAEFDVYLKNKCGFGI